MADAIVHRGPDEDGYLDRRGWASPTAGSPSSASPTASSRSPTRTAPSGASSTASSSTTRKCAEGLEAKGHRFRTHTDTELIPHLWEDHGEGMFDAPEGPVRLLPVRHRTQRRLPGPRPLRHLPAVLDRAPARRDDWLLFASEIKALLASGMVPAEPDLRGINHVFTFFAMPGPVTCFEGVNLLPPGHYLRVRLGTNPADAIEERTYWEMDFPDRGPGRRPAGTRSGRRVRAALHPVGRAPAAGRRAGRVVPVRRRRFERRRRDGEQGPRPADPDVHHRRQVEGAQRDAGGGTGRPARRDAAGRGRLRRTRRCATRTRS